jgi:hypothetical protein
MICLSNRDLPKGLLDYDAFLMFRHADQWHAVCRLYPSQVRDLCLWLDQHAAWQDLHVRLEKRT